MARKQKDPPNDFARRIRDAAKVKKIDSAPELRAFLIKHKRKKSDTGRVDTASKAWAHKLWNGETKLLRAHDVFWITEALDIRALWLLYGDGEMKTRPAPADPEQTRLLTLFAKAKESQKELLRQWMKTQEENSSDRDAGEG